MTDMVKRKASEAETALSQQFMQARDALPGNTAVAELRKDAFGRFDAAGLPTRRVEAWHYTDLRSFMGTALPAAAAPDNAALDVAREALAALPQPACRIVLVDGVYQPALSAVDASPQVSVTALDDALAGADAQLVRDLTGDGCGAGDAALDLNAALMGGGAVVDIAAGANIEAPLEIVSVATRRNDAAIFARSLVRAGSRAAATIVERHILRGDAALQANNALVIRTGDEADIAHIWVAEGQGDRQLHIHSLLATIGDKAKFSSFGLLDTGAFARRQIFARFDGAGASLDLSGLALVRDRDHRDTTLVVEHVHPNCKSSEYFKQIVDGAGTGVFQGRISVSREAQKTDGAMKSQTILLSDDAAMYNKPELEIFADDVACGHGATCGSLDPDQLFYAMARGLPRPQAEALLLEAFGEDAIDRVANEQVREELTGRLRHWLAGRTA
ncbi:MAG: Fe-S cluster assembly protein SufD [Hyphomicrobiales bacterium]|nr:Fe-S cluster assembly protein SufD [Planctomycetaceae bacterium]MCC2097709.1 Fe-S cluster assembly protein SufD [Hyphomicrobiales bacterium]